MDPSASGRAAVAPPIATSAEARARRQGALAAVALAALALALALALRAPVRAPAGLEQQRVEPTVLPRIDPAAPSAGEPIEVGGARGVPVLLHFWGPSCAPCVREAPIIADLAHSIHPAEVWTITTEGSDEVRSFLRERGLSFPVLQDVALAAHRAFLVSQIPATFVLDRDGVIARELRGPQTEATLRAAVAAASRSEGVE